MVLSELYCRSLKEIVGLFVIIEILEERKLKLQKITKYCTCWPKIDIKSELLLDNVSPRIFTVLSKKTAFTNC